MSTSNWYIEIPNYYPPRVGNLVIEIFDPIDIWKHIDELRDSYDMIYVYSTCGRSWTTAIKRFCRLHDLRYHILDDMNATVWIG